MSDADDREDIGGTIDRRIEHLVLSVADGTHRSGLILTMPDEPTRMLVEHLVEMVFIYAQGAAGSQRTTVEENLGGMLRALEVARVRRDER